MTSLSEAKAVDFWPPSWLSRALAVGAVTVGLLAIVIASRFGIGYGLGASAVAAGLMFPIVVRLFRLPVLPVPSASRVFVCLAVVS